jgi:hypothetical protein
MARRIPLVAAGVLYVLEPPGAPEIAVDSPAWAAWLRDPATRSFSFRGSSGAFTARKEAARAAKNIGAPIASGAADFERCISVKRRG